MRSCEKIGRKRPGQAKRPAPPLTQNDFHWWRRRFRLRILIFSQLLTRDLLGHERLQWLKELPRLQLESGIALVHASPASAWRAPGADSSDAELERVYAPLGQPAVVYGHNHHAYIRSVAGMKVANTGSVGLSYDGDRRAAYLLLDEGLPASRA